MLKIKKIEKNRGFFSLPYCLFYFCESNTTDAEAWSYFNGKRRRLYILCKVLFVIELYLSFILT